MGVEADAPQPGEGEDDRVEAITRAECGGRGARVGTQVDAAHAREPRGNVAAQVAHAQVGARGEHLGGAPGRSRADERALRQGCQGRPVGRAQGVAGVFALRDGRDAQPRRGGGGQVLEGVDGQVALSLEEGEPQLRGEHAHSAERGQGCRGHVAVRAHDLQLDAHILAEAGTGLLDRPRDGGGLGERQARTPGSQNERPRCHSSPFAPERAWETTDAMPVPATQAPVSATPPRDRTCSSSAATRPRYSGGRGGSVPFQRASR